MYILKPWTFSRWLLLCEDAFGIFFELSVEIDEEEEMWKHLLQHGEGQRIHFERIRVSGRTTKNKFFFVLRVCVDISMKFG